MVEGLFTNVTPKTIPPSATRADTSLYTREADYTVCIFAYIQNIKPIVEIAKGTCTPAMTSGGDTPPNVCGFAA
ncbi:MAG: hypothetical protein PUC29_01010 [Clostridia bacterium]|nr:hypothetical protein [Clostridia bacterium]